MSINSQYHNLLYPEVDIGFSQPNYTVNENFGLFFQVCITSDDSVSFFQDGVMVDVHYGTLESSAKGKLYSTLSCTISPSLLPSLSIRLPPSLSPSLSPLSIIPAADDYVANTGDLQFTDSSKTESWWTFTTELWKVLLKVSSIVLSHVLSVPPSFPLSPSVSLHPSLPPSLLSQ